MIRPKLSKVASGTRLTTDLVNGIINRTEYAADLLRQYKLVAGNGMYVEPHYDGTRISYLQPVAGGATPAKPISVIPKPNNPTILSCTEVNFWSKIDVRGSSECPNVGPPCTPIGESPSCIGLSVSGFIVSSAIWPRSCVSTNSPICSFSASFDDGGKIGDFECPYPGGCSSCSASGITAAQIADYPRNFNGVPYVYLYVKYFATNGPQGGPYGFSGSGAFTFI
jgi:hypothetical protein